MTDKWKELKDWLEGKGVFAEGDYFEGAQMAFRTVEDKIKELEEKDNG